MTLARLASEHALFVVLLCLKVNISNTSEAVKQFAAAMENVVQVLCGGDGRSDRTRPSNYWNWSMNQKRRNAKSSSTTPYRWTTLLHLPRYIRRRPQQSKWAAGWTRANTTENFRFVSGVSHWQFKILIYLLIVVIWLLPRVSVQHLRRYTRLHRKKQANYVPNTLPKRCTRKLDKKSSTNWKNYCVKALLEEVLPLWGTKSKLPRRLVVIRRVSR